MSFNVQCTMFNIRLSINWSKTVQFLPIPTTLINQKNILLSLWFTVFVIIQQEIKPLCKLTINFSIPASVQTIFFNEKHFLLLKFYQMGFAI